MFQLPDFKETKTAGQSFMQPALRITVMNVHTEKYFKKSSDFHILFVNMNSARGLSMYSTC